MVSRYLCCVGIHLMIHPHNYWLSASLFWLASAQVDIGHMLQIHYWKRNEPQRYNIYLILAQINFYNLPIQTLPFLRPVPTRPISRRPTAIVGRLLSADSRGFKILNMFDRDSRPTITESVVESADSAVESADYWSRLTGNGPSGYGP